MHAATLPNPYLNAVPCTFEVHLSHILCICKHTNTYIGSTMHVSLAPAVLDTWDSSCRFKIIVVICIDSLSLFATPRRQPVCEPTSPTWECRCEQPMQRTANRAGHCPLVEFGERAYSRWSREKTPYKLAVALSIDAALHIEVLVCIYIYEYMNIYIYIYIYVYTYIYIYIYIYIHVYIYIYIYDSHLIAGSFCADT